MALQPPGCPRVGLPVTWPAEVIKDWKHDRLGLLSPAHRQQATVQWAEFAWSWFTAHLATKAGARAGRSAGASRKVFRKTRDTLVAWDHQLRQITGQGFASFCGNPTSYALTKHGLQSRTFVVSVDQCSSGLTGLFWLQYQMGCRLVTRWGIFH